MSKDEMTEGLAKDMPKTWLHLDITNSIPENMFVVGVCQYIDDMMGLDYDNLEYQFQYIVAYLQTKNLKMQELKGMSPISEYKP